MIFLFSCNGLYFFCLWAGRLPCLHHIVERPDRNSTNRPRNFASSDESFFISAAESALAGIAALVAVGSAPALSHKTPEPRPSCRACGTYLHGRNAPGSN